MDLKRMLSKCVAKIFALEPKANAVEAGVITALLLTALLVTIVAVGEPLATLYSSVVSDVIVGLK
jgi:hypothetical protein